MKKTLLFSWIFFVLGIHFLMAQHISWYSPEQNQKKIQLELARQQYAENLKAATPEISIKKGTEAKKDVRKAVILSALVPGAGEAYSGNWTKAIGFFAAEVTLWSLKMHYDSRGDSKEEEFIRFANEHWSEMRYWTYVYLKGIENGLSGILYTGNDLDAIRASHGYLPPEFINSNLAKLREWERQLPGFTHQLPATKTQQYYEMIGKYAGQFGPAWDDASYDALYDGYHDQITQNNRLYMDMRKLANELYENARTAAQFILLNHIVSAIDAGFTAKFKNRQIDVSLKSDTRIVNRELTEFIGLHCEF